MRLFKKKIKHTTHVVLQISILVVLATLWFVGPALQELASHAETVEAMQSMMRAVPSPDKAPVVAAAPSPKSILDTILVYAKSIGTLALVVVQIILGIQQYKLRKK